MAAWRVDGGDVRGFRRDIAARFGPTRQPLGDSANRR